MKFKGLQKGDNVRDHFSKLELHVTDIAETSATLIAEELNAQGLEQNLEASKSGGKIGYTARQQIESIIGHTIMTKENMLTERQKKNRARLTENAGKKKIA